MLYIGIDLGTSACKLLLVDGSGAVLREVTKEYNRAPPVFPPAGVERAGPGGLVEGSDAGNVGTAVWL